MPQVGWNVGGDAEVCRDTAGGFGVLGPTHLPVDRLHVANREIDHMLEDRRIIEFRIFAIQFWCHRIVLKRPDRS
jgi:hypothetical protein